MINMNPTLKKLEEFHGHLGPYIVLGYKIGLIANEKLGNNPFEKKVKAFTGSTPPISCMIDGVQLSSGCTLGKGNIKVINEQKPMFEFSDKKELYKLTITLKKQIQTDIDTKVTEENMVNYSTNLFEAKNEELFDINER